MPDWRRSLKRRSRAYRSWRRHPRHAFWRWTALGIAVIASSVTVLSVWSTTLTMRHDVRSLNVRPALLHAQSVSGGGGWRSALFPENWTPVEDGVRLGVNVVEVAVGAPGKTLEDGTRLNVRQLRRPDGTPASVDLGAYHPYQFLHNFAYAGYHGGVEPLPPEVTPDCRRRGLPVFDVVRDYGCRPNLRPQVGGRDCRNAIQRAIDAAQLNGGVVYFPPGEYVITTEDNAASLRISGSNVTLCGAGRDRTFLKVDSRLSSGSLCREEGRTFCARHHQLVRAEPPSESANGWQQTTNVSAQVVKNEDFPTRRLTLAANPFAKNDEVVVAGKMTEAYRMEHDMVHEDGWPSGRAYEFRRTVVGVADNDIILDVPTRSRIRTYDEPTVAKLSRGHEGLREIGLENLSIGMVRHPQDWSTSDCPKSKDPKDCQEVRRGDGSFQFPAIRDIYDNRLIAFFNVRDSWLYQLTTYRPSENADEETYNEDGRRFNYPVEYLNMALYLENARFVTAKHLAFRGSQVDKGNHNGYAIQLQDTNEVLIEDVELRQVKKGFTFNGGGTSGNVIKDARHYDILDYQNDFHSYLSMANLIDGNLMDGNYWEASVRPLAPTRHGHGTTQTVFWNTEGRKRPTIQTEVAWDYDKPGLDYGIIVSNQFGWGYVIGTHGAFSTVVAAVKPNRHYEKEEIHPRIWPVDWLEGIGYDRLTEPRFQGQPLEPASLYEAQLALRLGQPKRLLPRLPPPCAPNWTCPASWSACSSSGEQTRTCTDANNCGVTTNKPAERQSCTPPPIPPPVVNVPPTVNAGADLTITLPASAALRGVVTDDGLPDPPRAVTLTWSPVSGPATVSFADRAAAITTATFSAPGSNVLRLAANDGLLIGTDELTVTVNPCAPSWTCADWSASACTGGRQTRTCTDSNCGNPTRAESQECTEPLPPPPPLPSLPAVTFIPKLEGGAETVSRTFTLIFFVAGSQNEVGRFTQASDDSTGALSLPPTLNLTAQSYDILVHADGYLNVKMEDVTLTDAMALPQLPAGDLNNDNVINTFDWSVMKDQWSTNDAVADLNRDDVVNSFDYSFLHTNWFHKGDE